MNLRHRTRKPDREQSRTSLPYDRWRGKAVPVDELMGPQSRQWVAGHQWAQWNRIGTKDGLIGDRDPILSRTTDNPIRRAWNDGVVILECQARIRTRGRPSRIDTVDRHSEIGVRAETREIRAALELGDSGNLPPVHSSGQNSLAMEGFAQVDRIGNVE